MATVICSGRDCVRTAWVVLFTKDATASRSAIREWDPSRSTHTDLGGKRSRRKTLGACSSGVPEEAGKTTQTGMHKHGYKLPYLLSVLRKTHLSFLKKPTVFPMGALSPLSVFAAKLGI